MARGMVPLLKIMNTTNLQAIVVDYNYVKNLGNSSHWTCDNNLWTECENNACKR
eukprot:c16698_g1_i1 orf=330-491(+)